MFDNPSDKRTIERNPLMTMTIFEESKFQLGQIVFLPNYDWFLEEDEPAATLFSAAFTTTKPAFGRAKSNDRRMRQLYGKEEH